MVAINHTHDPAARSWVAGANRPDGDFPIQNLPFAVFQRPDEQHHWRGGVAIGDQIVDMHALGDAALLEGAAAAALRACLSPSLNALFRLGPTAWRALRHGLFDLLKEGAPPAGRDAVAACLVLREDAIFKVAVDVGDYTDFYTSLFHADNIGRAMGLELVTPNFRWMPLAYHGRASSIGVSGRQVRPRAGQAFRRGHPAAPGMPEAGLRGRAGDLHRAGQCGRRAGPDRRGRGQGVRHRPAQ